jgi:hypothetical protein
MSLARSAVLFSIAMVLAGCGSDDLSRGYILPAGDPVAGKQAFVELQCWACHNVVGHPDVPQPVSVPPGPAIDADTGRALSGVIATSIVIPSHSISGKKGPWDESELSPMGDYTDEMTVRQLIDLVAFIKSTASPAP